MCVINVFFTDTATTEIYTYLQSLSLHRALPILDLIAKGKMPESAAPEAAAAYQRLMAQDQVRVAFNGTFLTGADSTDPTLAGIWGAFRGSLITMFVTLLISYPDRKSTRLNSSH